MRVSRLYTSLPLNQGQTVELDDEGAHYLRSVLRLKAGDAIVLFNGDGGEFQCRVDDVSRKFVRIALEKVQERSVESPLHVTLGLGISRGDRMDLSVQKAVELGVNQITPLLTERCVVQFKNETKPQRWLHWQKIIQHAAEQSGRTVLPELSAIEPLYNWADNQQGLKVFLDPYAQTSLADLLPVDMKVTLLTGPEGGFADQERELAQAAEFIPVRLGQRILRTETASLAALAAVQMLWGDFK
jgi:16S rRNA (uracil1498-N3)-methyltransferase